jgi:hypothetical protein
MLDTRWFDMRTDAEINAGDLGEEKERIILVPMPTTAPVKEPSPQVAPEVVPEAEPVPA